jgi:hypothetical protein
MPRAQGRGPMGKEKKVSGRKYGQSPEDPCKTWQSKARKNQGNKGKNQTNGQKKTST